MIKINLVGEGKRPTAVRRKKEISARLAGENLALYLLLFGLVPGLLAVGVNWWLLKSDLEAKTAEAVRLQKEYDALKKIIQEVEDFKKKKAELEQKIEVINNLKLNQVGPVRVMDYVSRALPELVWLDRMEINRGSIRLVGRGQNENAVANFVDNLDQVEGFQEPVFRHMRSTGNGVFSFDVSIAYTLTKPESPGASDEDEAADGSDV